MIRRAHADLATRFFAGKFNKEEVVNLVPGVEFYDYPDDAEPGQLYHVYVARSATEGRFELRNGIPPAVENDAYESEMPLWWTEIDNQIRIYPAPTTAWTLMYFKYKQRSPEMTSDTDRTQMDDEAVVRLASALFLATTRPKEAAYYHAEAERFIDRLMRSTRSNARGFQSGYKVSDRDMQTRSPLPGDALRWFRYDTGQYR